MSPTEFNQKCIEKLKQLRFHERVAVIGSGLSYKLIKNINELVKAMEGPCCVKKCDNELSSVFLDRAFNSNPGQYNRILREAFETRPAWAASAYLHLVRIPFKSFVTFNLDVQLPDAYVMSRSTSEIHFRVYPSGHIYLPTELAGPTQRLVALHGYKNPNNPDWYKSLILRYQEYEDHYSWKQNAPAPFLFMWWYWLLTTLPCVFIGTSLEEIGLASVIRHIKNGNHDSFEKQQHIHLKETDDSGPDYPAIEQMSLGSIRQVLYDRVDEDHQGLRQVLSAFSGYRDGGPVPSEDEAISFKDSLEFLKGAPPKKPL